MQKMTRVEKRELKPTISVVIASRNEGTDLAMTAAMAAYGSIKPRELIVVDDCSDDPVDEATLPRMTKVIRPGRQLGPAGAKALGVNSSTSDIAVVLDSHMRMPHWWLEAYIDAYLAHPNAIQVPACCTFRHGRDDWFHGAGCVWKTEPAPNDNIPFISFPDPIWIPYEGPKDQSVGCLMGAAYLLPRKIWDRLGGYNPCFFGWGMEEQDLSLRAYQLGYDVRCFSNLTVAHNWKRNKPGYFMNSWEPGFNAAVMCSTIFEDGVYEERFEALLRKAFPSEKVWERFESQRDAIMATRQIIQSNRQLTDEQLLEVSGYRWP